VLLRGRVMSDGLEKPIRHAGRAMGLAFADSHGWEFQRLIASLETRFGYYEDSIVSESGKPLGISLIVIGVPTIAKSGREPSSEVCSKI
jgi:hypothetical protein